MKIIKVLLPYLLVIAAVIVLAKIGGIGRWLFTTDGVSAEQAHTIDSLRVANNILDSSLTTALRQQEDLRKARSRQHRADSIATEKAVDSLKALIPDTATVVLRPIHDAIVLRLEARIDTLEYDLYISDSLLSRRSFDLMELRRQNNKLLEQVNSLEKKANPGLVRRVKIALPFIAATWGSCKLGLLDCG